MDRFYHNNRLGFLLLSVLLVSLVGMSVLIYSIQRNNLMTRLEEVVEADIRTFTFNIDDKVVSVVSDLFLLEETFKMNESFSVDEGVVKFTSTIEQNKLQNFVIEWMSVKQVYDQIRLIDMNGNEVFRVNYDQGNIHAVDANELQNKGDRYYFMNSVNLDDSSVYLSEIDLNVENGQIEYVNNKPKSMLRIASPIYLENGNQLGVLIINYLADDLLEPPAEIQFSEYTEFEVINSDGYFLYAEDESIEFGFMYDEKLDEVFSKYHHFELLDNTTDGEISQFIFEGELYTSTVISEASLSQVLLERIGKDVEVVSESGNLYVFGEVEYTSLREFSSNVGILILGIVTATLISAFITKYVDEQLRNRQIILRELKYASDHDELTGLVKRDVFKERVKDAIPNGVTILFMDINGFKQVNDTYGHLIGDEILKEAALRFLRVVRDTDVVARYGGDEFVIMLNSLTKLHIIDRICKDLISEFENEFVINGTVVKVGISIGIQVSTFTEDVNLLLEEADKAMYEAKAKGRSSYVLYKKP